MLAKLCEALFDYGKDDNVGSSAANVDSVVGNVWLAQN